MLAQEKASLEEQIAKINARMEARGNKRQVKHEGDAPPRKKSATAPSSAPPEAPEPATLKRQGANVFPNRSSSSLDQPKPKPSSRGPSDADASRPVAAPLRMGGRKEMSRSDSCRAITPTLRESTVGSASSGDEDENERDPAGRTTARTEALNSGRWGVVYDPKTGKAT